ncbi:MAG: hypothetical protein JRH20_30675, partial [Deltaproteobacteria bacterium]|nr:hypothetical protein [Deltaproteobacteria bacterium]
MLVVEDGGSTYICRLTSCDGKVLECGDCEDNDGDGLIDFRDPECLGPCDNTEGPGLDPGVGGTTAESCGVDCYFDYGNGPGNDKCIWDHRCDTLSPEEGCEYEADFAADERTCPAEQLQACTDFCLPYTPNGCDCFGCCTFPGLEGQGDDGADVYVWIGNMDDSNVSTCTLADVTDPVKCPPCTPVGNCLNPCGRCEVCVGKPTVPDDCFAPQVPDGGIPDISVPEAGLPDG